MVTNGIVNYSVTRYLFLRNPYEHVKINVAVHSVVSAQCAACGATRTDWRSMKRKENFSVSDFAKLARTTRDTLIYYDKIGLLSPASRGENNYRTYSLLQLGIINLIRTLQTLGMPLNEIKRLRSKRTPELIDAVLENQITHITEEIEELTRAMELLRYFKTTIHAHLDIDKAAISIENLPEATIMLGDQNDYSGDRNDYDALLSFYSSCSEKYPDLDLNYPVWGFFSAERIRNRDWIWPDRYYIYTSKGQAKRPAALYAVGFTHGWYGQSNDLYVRILDYIDANSYEICGPAFEEYPLNEICVLEEKDYLMRVMITVRKRGSHP